MNIESQVALRTARGLPKSVLDRMLEDESFVSLLELSTIRIQDIGGFSQAAITTAVGSLDSTGSSVELMTTDATRVHLVRTPGGLVLKDVTESAERGVPEFELLHPTGDRRIAAFEEMLAACSPALRTAASWRDLLQERVPTEAELRRLGSDLALCPSAVADGIRDKWLTGTIGTKDLVPRSRKYYEGLIGPLPVPGASLDSYLDTVLEPHLQQTTQQGLNKSLPFLLALNISPRLNLAKCLQSALPPEIFQQLKALESTASPFVSIGVLELARAHRSSDQRLAEIEAGAVRRLTGEDPTFASAYVLLPSFVRLTLRILSTADELATSPVWWRRLAAYAHAQVLLSIIDGASIDASAFSTWCDEQLTSQMVAARLLDLQSEPNWDEDQLTPDTLRAECLALVAIATSEPPPLAPQEAALIKKAFEALRTKGLFISTIWPGPVDVDFEPKGLAGLDAEAIKPIIQDLSSENPLPAWHRLSMACRVFAFDAPAYDQMATTVRTLALPADALFETLAAAAVISAAHREMRLANEVADRVVSEASTLDTVEAAERAWRVLLMAGAAETSRSKYLAWLAERLEPLCRRVPRGLPLDRISQNLEALNTLLPVEERVLGTARAIARSGQ